MEAMMAATILAVAVVAVTWAVASGQQQSVHAKELISATLAAEELLGEVTIRDYAFLEDEAGARPVGSHQARIFVDTILKDLPGLGTRVRGKEVKVQILTADSSRVVVELMRFVPEPQP